MVRELISHSPPIYVIRAVMIVWRIRRKIVHCSTTIVRSYKHTHVNNFYRCTKACLFKPGLGFWGFSYIEIVCYFGVFGVFSLVCLELSVPVQVIAWKDSSLKWPIMC